MQACDALIHEFDINRKPITLDEEGDPMVGFYYQFIDINSVPVTGLIGPYKLKLDCVAACKRAFKLKDY